MSIEALEFVTEAGLLRLRAILNVHALDNAKSQHTAEHDNNPMYSPSHGSSISKLLFWEILVYTSQMKCSDCTKKDYPVESQ